MSKKVIYVAAPLFSDPEKAANEAMCSILERYFDVFLPQRDGHLLPDLISRGMDVEMAYSYIFRKDIEAVKNSDVVIINLDGRSVDEGAAFELGVAFAQGKYCIGYRTDVRTLLPWGLNPMLVSPLSEMIHSLEELDGWCARFVGNGSSSRPTRKTAKA